MSTAMIYLCLQANEEGSPNQAIINLKDLY